MAKEQDFGHLLPKGTYKVDVGFIENQGKNYTCSGYWKTYGDPQEAKRRFDSYRECTEVCREKYRQGTPIIQLVKAA